MSAAEIRERIGGNWTERSDGWWLSVPIDKIRQAAEAMREGEARFAALVGSAGNPGQLHLSWHWDFKGILLSIETTLGNEEHVPSIVDVYPGADWAERELRDYYAVTFDGRACTPALMLREGDIPGILLNPERGRP